MFAGIVFMRNRIAFEVLPTQVMSPALGAIDISSGHTQTRTPLGHRDSQVEGRASTRLARVGAVILSLVLLSYIWLWSSEATNQFNLVLSPASQSEPPPRQLICRLSVCLSARTLSFTTLKPANVPQAPIKNTFKYLPTLVKKPSNASKPVKKRQHFSKPVEHHPNHSKPQDRFSLVVTCAFVR